MNRAVGRLLPAIRKLLLPIAAAALAAPATTAAAQVVQLPTLHVFSADTTVMVPDRGTMPLGGFGRAAAIQRQQAPPVVGRLPAGAPLRQRVAAAEHVARGITATAQIHDFEAMDRALLDAAQRRAPDPRQLFARGGHLSDHAAQPAAVATRPSSAERPAEKSLAELLRRRQEAAQAASQESDGYAEMARRAEAEGKTALARYYRQLAERRAQPRLTQSPASSDHP